MLCCVVLLLTTVICSKVLEYEEELNLLANNLKSVEVALDKANEKEYEYENTVKDLDERLEEALKRAEFAERTINKLEQQVRRRLNFHLFITKFFPISFKFNVFRPTPNL